MKRCIKCEEEKTLSEFYRHVGAKDGFRNVCKSCWAKNRKPYSRAKKSRSKESNKEPKTEKRCPKCGEVKPVSEFSPRPERRGGLKPRCKACVKVDRRAKREQLKQLHDEDFYQNVIGEKKCSVCKEIKPYTDFDRLRSEADGFQCLCKPCGRKKSKAYSLREDKREHLLAKKMEWYYNNLEGAKRREVERQKRRRTDPELKRKLREYHRRYYRTPKGMAIAQHNGAKRRAQKLKLPTDLTSDKWLEILDFFNYRCVYCGVSGRMAMDHVIPLHQNGHHVSGNVLPACKSCNSSKKERTLEEFLGNEQYTEWLHKMKFEFSWEVPELFENGGSLQGG